MFNEGIGAEKEGIQECWTLCLQDQKRNESDMLAKNCILSLHVKHSRSIREGQHICTVCLHTLTRDDHRTFQQGRTEGGCRRLSQSVVIRSVRVTTES
jgi:hypothetical protein